MTSPDAPNVSQKVKSMSHNDSTSHLSSQSRTPPPSHPLTTQEASSPPKENLFLPLSHAFDRFAQAYSPRRASLSPTERFEELVELDYPWIVSDHLEDEKWGHWHSYTEQEKREFQECFEHWAGVEEQRIIRKASGIVRSYETRHVGPRKGPWRVYELRMREF